MISDQKLRELDAGSTANRDMRDLVAEVRRLRALVERAAVIAESYGRSRPPARPGRQYEDRHLGECAASSGIAHLLRAQLVTGE